MVEVSEPAQRDSSVAQRLGPIGADRQRLSDQPISLLEPLLLHGDDAEQMQRLGVARRGGENLPIERFGLCQLAMPMQVQRFGHQAIAVACRLSSVPVQFDLVVRRRIAAKLCPKFTHGEHYSFPKLRRPLAIDRRSRE